MKVQTHQVPRKLIAVIGATGEGLAFANGPSACIYIDNGTTIHHETCSLMSFLNANEGRKPIYEGDVITIQF